MSINANERIQESRVLEVFAAEINNIIPGNPELHTLEASGGNVALAQEQVLTALENGLEKQVQRLELQLPPSRDDSSLMWDEDTFDNKPELQLLTPEEVKWLVIIEQIQFTKDAVGKEKVMSPNTYLTIRGIKQGVILTKLVEMHRIVPKYAIRTARLARMLGDVRLTEHRLPVVDNDRVNTLQNRLLSPEIKGYESTTEFIMYCRLLGISETSVRSFFENDAFLKKLSKKYNTKISTHEMGRMLSALINTIYDNKGGIPDFDDISPATPQQHAEKTQTLQTNQTGRVGLGIALTYLPDDIYFSEVLAEEPPQIARLRIMRQGIEQTIAKCEQIFATLGIDLNITDEFASFIGDLDCEIDRLPLQVTIPLLNATTIIYQDRNLRQKITKETGMSERDLYRLLSRSAKLQHTVIITDTSMANTSVQFIQETNETLANMKL